MTSVWSTEGADSAELANSLVPSDGAAEAPSARPASRSIVMVPGRSELDPAKSSRRDKRIVRALSIIVPVALLLLWQLAAKRGWIDVRFFPAPTKVLSDWRQLFKDGQYWDDLWASVQRILYGYLWGAGLGLLIGLMIGRLRLVHAALEPTIVALYTVPKLAILPLLLLIFGIGESPKIILIAITVLFIVLINTMGALESVPAGHLEAGRSFGLNRVNMVRHVILPSALPQIFIGLRLAAGIAVLALVGAEFVAAKSGLGFLIWNSWNIGVPSYMYIGIISIAVLGVLANSLLRFLQRIAVPWDR
jgi:ABC-type nitrate/sulfonate/bicarbonate transport system permease component